MKLFINNTIFIDNEECNYKCLVEDSHSKQLEKVTAAITNFKIYKTTVVTITIDKKHEDYSDEIRDIGKDIREVIEALKGCEKMIISIKFDDLSNIKI
ncbi:MAG: hypothetical protein ACTSPQ_22360 [Candidatus Helarchaeota archaeon]